MATICPNFRKEIIMSEEDEALVWKMHYCLFLKYSFRLKKGSYLNFSLAVPKELWIPGGREAR